MEPALDLIAGEALKGRQTTATFDQHTEFVKIAFKSGYELLVEGCVLRQLVA
jgi:hypothetical protein